MKNRIFAVAAVYLLGAIAVFAQGSNPAANSSGVSLTPLRQFSFQQNLYDSQPATIAFDNGHFYISSPGGILFETDSLEASTPMRPIFQSATPINKVYVYDHVLYVVAGGEAAETMQHTLFKSSDEGKSFQTIDSGLLIYEGPVAYYLVPNQLFVQGNLLFANAGGGDNLFVSSDNGEEWILLSGSGIANATYHSTLDITGREVLQGGENLDIVYLNRGVLSRDKLSWTSPLQPAQRPFLSNRKINAINQKPGTHLVLATPEAALLRSVDDGRTYEYVFVYEQGGTVFPWLYNILFSSHDDLALIGGFNKDDGFPPYLAYGTQNGTTWTDISALLGNVPTGNVTDLAEDNQGRLLAVVKNSTAKQVTIYEVTIKQ